MQMATMHAPGTGVEPGGGRHRRQGAMVAAVALVLAVVVVPFGLRDLGGDDARASPAAHPTPSPASPPSTPSTAARRDPGVGSRGDLPALLPAARTPVAGTRVRLGDITDGVLRRTSDGTWQVRVRWNGRLQPVETRGQVGLS